MNRNRGSFDLLYGGPLGVLGGCLLDLTIWRLRQGCRLFLLLTIFLNFDIHVVQNPLSQLVDVLQVVLGQKLEVLVQLRIHAAGPRKTFARCTAQVFHVVEHAEYVFVDEALGQLAAWLV